MNKLRCWVVAVASLSLVAAAPAAASPQDPAKTPEGYTFCGWKDFVGGWWTLEQSDPGVYMVAFTRGMTCRAARLNVDRVRYSQRSPYRPYRTGYRCRTLASQHEYSDVRCVKVGGTRKFRYRTGA